MFYIFNKNGLLLCTCDFEPNKEDLNSREEYFVEYSEDLELSRVIGGKFGGIYESVETPEESVQKEVVPLLQKRNKLLVDTDWVITRHFEEKMLGKETTLSDIQISEFLGYRQALRDITQLEGFPFISFPVKPQFRE